MNCKNITLQISKIKKLKIDLDFLEKSEYLEERSAISQKLSIELNKILSEPMPLDDEIMKLNKELWDWLDIPNEFHKWQQRSQITVPTIEQRFWAEKSGYVIPIIIPSHLSDRYIVSKVDKKYKETSKNKEAGVTLTGKVKNNLEGSKRVENDPPYLVFFKRGMDTKHANPETIWKTPQEVEKMIKKINTKTPALNLHGLNIQEYLMINAFSAKRWGKMIDKNDKTWILDWENEGEIAFACQWAEVSSSSPQGDPYLIHMSSSDDMTAGKNCGSRLVSIPLAIEEENDEL